MYISICFFSTTELLVKLISKAILMFTGLPVHGVQCVRAQGVHRAVGTLRWRAGRGAAAAAPQPPPRPGLALLHVVSTTAPQYVF